MIPFTKMHGIGNDFVVVDAVRHPIDGVDVGALSRALNDRHFGVGGDGLIIAEHGEAAPFRMRMYNPDGSDGGMCGNGVRCAALLLRDHGHVHAHRFPMEVGARQLEVELLDESRVRVDMGRAELHRGTIGMAGNGGERFIAGEVKVDGTSYTGTAVSMGNPHLVIFVDDVAAIDLERLGPALEHHELFPSRTNVHFAQVLDRGRIRQRTWERGAGATLACGSGACAGAVAAVENGYCDRSVAVELPGGELTIEYDENGTVHMTGPAEVSFEGTWEG